MRVGRDTGALLTARGYIGYTGSHDKTAKVNGKEDISFIYLPRCPWIEHLNQRHKELTGVSRGEFRLLLQVLQMVVIPGYDDSGR